MDPLEFLWRPAERASEPETLQGSILAQCFPATLNSETLTLPQRQKHEKGRAKGPENCEMWTFPFTPTSPGFLHFNGKKNKKQNRNKNIQPSAVQMLYLHFGPVNWALLCILLTSNARPAFAAFMLFFFLVFFFHITNHTTPPSSSPGSALCVKLLEWWSTSKLW